jgi:hypothetical protein
MMTCALVSTIYNRGFKLSKLSFEHLLCRASLITLFVNEHGKYTAYYLKLLSSWVCCKRPVLHVIELFLLLSNVFSGYFLICYNLFIAYVWHDTLLLLSLLPLIFRKVGVQLMAENSECCISRSLFFLLSISTVKLSKTFGLVLVCFVAFHLIRLAYFAGSRIQIIILDCKNQVAYNLHLQVFLITNSKVFGIWQFALDKF